MTGPFAEAGALESWGMRKPGVRAHRRRWPVVCIGLFLCAGVLWSQSAVARSVTEDFDGPLGEFGDQVVRHRLVSLSAGEGVGGTTGIKVAYQGNEEGSRRVLAKAPLEVPAVEYALGFAVRFCPGFDFAKGGKLHGLGPREPVTGGKPVTPAGWSARLMFRANGGLMTYVYHQEQPRRFGEVKVAQDFRFTPGVYHRVRMQVRLNEPSSAANGFVRVSVDGRELIRHEGIRFRSVEGADGLIQTVLFSTFHGGSTPDWAPRTENGAFKTDCAFFDDFRVDMLSQ